MDKDIIYSWFIAALFVLMCIGVWSLNYELKPIIDIDIISIVINLLSLAVGSGISLWISLRFYKKSAIKKMNNQIDRFLEYAEKSAFLLTHKFSCEENVEKQLPDCLLRMRDYFRDLESEISDLEEFKIVLKKVAFLYYRINTFHQLRALDLAMIPVENNIAVTRSRYLRRIRRHDFFLHLRVRSTKGEKNIFSRRVYVWTLLNVEPCSQELMDRTATLFRAVVRGRRGIFGFFWP